MFNILAGIYALWGICALPASYPRFPGVSGWAWLALLAGYLPSVVASPDAGASLVSWLKFSSHTLALPFTLAALQAHRTNVHGLMKALGYGGLALLAVLWILFPYQFHRPDYDPVRYLQEDNLPFLFPFVLYALYQTKNRWWRWIMVTSSALLLVGYILVSNGRAALLGLAVAGAAMAIGLTPTIRRRALLAFSAILIGTALVGILTLSRPDAPHDRKNWKEWVYFVTSGRSELWIHAFQNPPRSLATGVGFGQEKTHPEVLHNRGNPHVGHLHNFLMDAWYETGFLGLLGLLFFLSIPIRITFGLGIAPVDPNYRMQIMFAAGIAAILTSAMLSFSYTSRQFSLYLPMLIAALVHLRHAKPACEPTSRDVQTDTRRQPGQQRLATLLHGEHAK